MLLQRDLINALVQKQTNIELVGVIPAYYALSQIKEQTQMTWGHQLSILNGIPSQIRFFVTGRAIVSRGKRHSGIRKNPVLRTVLRYSGSYSRTPLGTPVLPKMKFLYRYSISLYSLMKDLSIRAITGHMHASDG